MPIVLPAGTGARSLGRYQRHAGATCGDARPCTGRWPQYLRQARTTCSAVRRCRCPATGQALVTARPACAHVVREGCRLRSRWRYRKRASGQPAGVDGAAAWRSIPYEPAICRDRPYRIGRHPRKRRTWTQWSARLWISGASPTTRSYQRSNSAPSAESRYPGPLVSHRRSARSLLGDGT